MTQQRQSTDVRRPDLQPVEEVEHTTGAAKSVSIVIPTLDEERAIGAVLDATRRLERCVEIIVADGGSGDDTQQIARSCGARVIEAERGRGAQLHAGALAARGDVLWFLHADAIPPPGADEELLRSLDDPGTVGGNFGVRFDGGSRAARFLTWLYPRLRLLGLLYGDSGIFVRRDAYHLCGGFRPYPIFEDLDFVRRLRRHGRLAHLPVSLVASSRRFERRSFALTFARWAGMQTLFWAGVSPYKLARGYAPIRGHDAAPPSAANRTTEDQPGSNTKE